MANGELRRIRRCYNVASELSLIDEAWRASTPSGSWNKSRQELKNYHISVSELESESWKYRSVLLAVCFLLASLPRRPNSLSRNLEGRFQVPGQFYCWPSLWLCCSGAAELFLSVLSAKFSNRPSETFQDQWLKRYQMTSNETCTWIPSSRNDILGGQLSDFTWLQTFTVSTGTCTLLHYVIVHLCWFGR